MRLFVFHSAYAHSLTLSGRSATGEVFSTRALWMQRFLRKCDRQFLSLYLHSFSYTKCVRKFSPHREIAGMDANTKNDSKLLKQNEI